MSFRTGTYRTQEVPKRLRRFCPVRAVDTILDVSPKELAEAGKKLVLLDADNTLVPWRSHEFEPRILEWVAACKAGGLNLVLISNTRNRERLKELAGVLGVEYAEGKFKPHRSMYEWAMERHQATPAQTLMIGDQIFTDIWGANRLGIEAVLVRPMGDREFIGTKVNRTAEKLVLARLKRNMELSEDDLPIAPHQGIFHKKIVRQFLKFCIVGGSSFAIDYAIRMGLQFNAPWGDRLLAEVAGDRLVEWMPFLTRYISKPSSAFWPVAVFCGSAVAIVNSFIWNRLWTFRIRGEDGRGEQFKKFLLISLLGMVLNVVISTIGKWLIPLEPKAGAQLATVIAAGVVAFWNFFGQRLYAFKVEQQ